MSDILHITNFFHREDQTNVTSLNFHNASTDNSVTMTDLEISVILKFLKKLGDIPNFFSPA